MPPRMRLTSHDYSAPGWYFVTTVTAGRRKLFGSVTSAGVDHSPMGRLVLDEWESTLGVKKWISCAGLVLMPDHFHALVGWDAVPGNRDPSLSSLMSNFKGHSTKRLRQCGLLRSWDGVWARGYWDHVIRDRRHFDAVQRYIEANPARAWEKARR
ncbi:MAG: transposase [Gemmatimonadales bacterium]